MGKETFDLVDLNDKFLFRVKGKKALHSMKHPHRAVHVLMETYGKGFIIQRKAKGTENAGKLSSAVSGHVRAGETYWEAAIRETKEELGIEIDSRELKYLDKLPPSKATGNEFVVVYSYLLDSEEKKLIGRGELSEEVEGLIITSISDLVEDIKVNSNEYSPAFILAFKCFNRI